jgi:hypothetical protein
MTTAASGPLPYGSPAAFRAALTDRLKALASTSPFGISELQRQFAYDRLLTRIFTAPDSDRWVLKGATALLARLDIARHSKDVDLSCQSATDLNEADDAFRAAARRDIGDFFYLDVGPSSPLIGDKGRRFAIVSRLGGRTFASFSVDLVAGQSMTAEPEMVPPLVKLAIPGLFTVDYRAYRGNISNVSTRYKDLVDLVLIARTQHLAAPELRLALLSETGRRGILLPEAFDAPGPLWPAGYEAKASEVPDLGHLAQFASGLDLVKKMIDPILRGTAHGRWEPDRGAWIE